MLVVGQGPTKFKGPVFRIIQSDLLHVSHFCRSSDHIRSRTVQRLSLLHNYHCYGPIVRSFLPNLHRRYRKQNERARN